MRRVDLNAIAKKKKMNQGGRGEMTKNHNFSSVGAEELGRSGGTCWIWFLP